MKTGRYSLLQLLDNNEIEQIIIPEIQRDYVWKKTNVNQLIHSILTNFRAKQEINIDIKDGNQQIDETILEFLKKEYSRIKHATQIGFIYAYHDRDYAGKFFLIDGQQRITTLYLLLLALYCKAGKTEEFRSKYFYNQQLKLDYKVREASHDFMQNFVEFKLRNLDGHFENCERYYADIYQLDVTTKTLKDNYEFIAEIINKEPITELTGLIDYVENYIEFNYFDTHLSEQGEQLYLYMNSRGESLSVQEIVKTTIIKRAVDKKEAGKKWEDWQNFFWKHRMIEIDGKIISNPNADKGFEEFLKWATIIHACTSPNGTLTLDEKINLIKIETESEKIHFQKEEIKKYQLENETFNIEYLSSLYGSLNYLSNQRSERWGLETMIKAPFFRKGWLTELKYAIDYVSICGVLYYLSHFQLQVNETDVNRIGMYLKNICYSQLNSNDPSRAVIRSLESIRQLIESNMKDIIHIQNVEKGSTRVVSNSDKLLLDYYDKSNREAWENSIWDITNQNEFAKFLDGNYTILFESIEFENGDCTPERFSAFGELFKERIYNRRNDNQLTSELLRLGDISIAEGLSTKFNLNRWSLLKNEESNWRRLFNEKKEIIIRYLNTQNVELIEIPTDWREPFIRDTGALGYMNKKMYLWESEHRYILVQNTQASEYNTREVQIHLFHKMLPLSWVFKYDVCVQEFLFKDDQLVFTNWNNNNRFFIDIQFQTAITGGFWFLYLGYRPESDKGNENKMKEFECIINSFFGDEKWDLVEENKFKLIRPFYKDDAELSIIQNVENAYKQFCKVIKSKIE